MRTVKLTTYVHGPGREFEIDNYEAIIDIVLKADEGKAVVKQSWIAS